MRPFDSGHEDLIHDVAYDFYGRHVASCSSDQHIKVFRLEKETGEWQLSDSWRGHDSSIVSLDWASPEYGRIIASASYDKTIRLWEENPDEKEGLGRRWTKLATLNDSKGSLYDVKFAPSHLGLKLAAIGNDGVLRVYDALEPSDLRSWTMTSEISVLPIAPASHLQSDFCLSWCPSRFSTEKLAVSVLDQALIYQREKDNQLHVVAKLEGHGGLIRSVSWAPSIGRWYQLVATGCKDGKVRIFKLTERADPKSNNTSGSVIDEEANDNESINGGSNNSQEQSSGPFSSQSPLQVELISEHDDHDGEVWSVSWNLTGTILSSAGDDGKVRLWRATYSNEFKCMSVISAHQQAPRV
ncbi:epoxide hydrolase, soluble [Zygosaccharomyces mellis]|uniref:Epoxide hydrolase, soluble n=1 Tax=Zygosaccharomyces mellis TaxID=42258 RepID=A0A4C2EA00_9SACH|nr:epoxide hydrolase, soluble [Zygosaccharomyces mellis]